jgi:hypothetical protein
VFPVATGIRASPVVVGLGTGRSPQAERPPPPGKGSLGLICFALRVIGPPTGERR